MLQMSFTILSGVIQALYYAGVSCYVYVISRECFRDLTDTREIVQAICLKLINVHSYYNFHAF